jgi:hypothetical protein
MLRSSVRARQKLPSPAPSGPQIDMLCTKDLEKYLLFNLMIYSRLYYIYGQIDF